MGKMMFCWIAPFLSDFGFCRCFSVSVSCSVMMIMMMIYIKPPDNWFTTSSDLIYSTYFIVHSVDKNQSDLRRFKLKSCKFLIVEQTKNISCYSYNYYAVIPRGTFYNSYRITYFLLL